MSHIATVDLDFRTEELDTVPDKWIVNLRDVIDEDGSITAKSGQARRLAQHFAAIVREITGELGGESFFPKVRCRRRPNRKRCTGNIDSILETEDDTIIWECPVCGDRGSIRNWKGTLYDFSEVSEWD